MIEDKELLEDAIKHFKSLQKRYTREHNGKMCTKVAVALEAMEKQVPKKPIRLTNKLLIDIGWIYGCPACGCACGENKYHEDITADDIYCTQCGQRLE